MSLLGLTKYTKKLVILGLLNSYPSSNKKLKEKNQGVTQNCRLFHHILASPQLWDNGSLLSLKNHPNASWWKVAPSF